MGAAGARVAVLVAVDDEISVCRMLTAVAAVVVVPVVSMISCLGCLTS